jgi:murein DD-endopeptidase MepM/ murein hydrolase activator NlpD
MSTLESPKRRPTRVLLALAATAAFLAAGAAAEPTYHVLAKGETLYSVARSYGLSVDEVAKANSIADPARILPGIKLLIPRSQDAPAGDGARPAPRTEHEVGKGETLFSIAREYGVTVDALRAANKLGPSSLLKAGDRILVPAGARPAEGGAVPVAAAPAGDAAGSEAPGAGSRPHDAVPAMPDPVRTTVKTVSPGLSWPCPGEILYLEGKAFGVVIRARLGETEKAVAAGVVSSAGPYRGYGNVVVVLTRGGYVYAYGGNESVSVRAGDKVAVGQELGKVGTDAKQGGPAAYFLVFKDGEAVDPAKAPRD